MDTEIINILRNLMLDDDTTRTDSERRIRELFVNCEQLPILLCQIVICSQLSVEERQMAAITLKNLLLECWNNDYRQISIQTKSKVCDTIFQGLCDDLQQIRAISANVTLTIIEHDDPNDGNNIFDRVLNFIKHGSIHAIDGSLLLILEVMKSDDFNLAEIGQFFVELMPNLLGFLTYSDDLIQHDSIKMKAMHIFRDYLQTVAETLHNESIELTKVPKLVEFIQQWLHALKAVLQKPVNNKYYELKIECIECLSKIHSEAADLTEEHLIDIHQCIQNDIFHLVQQSSEESTKSKLMCAYLNFVTETLIEPPIKSMIANDHGSTEMLERLLWLLLRCMQMSEEVITKLSAGHFHFLIETMIIESNDGSVRYMARKTWRVINRLFGESVRGVMETTIQKYVMEMDKADSSNSWWKTQEACLYCLSSLSEDVKESKSLKFDLEGFISNIVLRNMSNTQYPILQGRAFSFVALFIEKLPLHLAINSIEMIATGLVSNERITKVSALFSLYQLKQHPNLHPYILQHQVAMMEIACSLIPHLHNDSLSFALNALNFSINIASEVSVQYEHAFIPIYLATWHQQYRFGSASSRTAVQMAIEELASNRLLYPCLCRKALPTIKDLLSNTDNDPFNYKVAVELLNILIQYDTTPLDRYFIDEVFKPIIRLIFMEHEDKELTKLLQTSLNLYVIKDADHLMEWLDPETGKSGIEFTVAYVFKLLSKPPGDRQTEENEIIGDIMLALVINCGNLISSVLPELLFEFLKQLEYAPSRLALESYIMIFSHLIIHQQDAALLYLENTKIGNKNGFEILMPLWVEFSESFTSDYFNKSSVIALSLVYSATENFATLQTLPVKGEIVLGANTVGVRTRSQTRKNPDQHNQLLLETKIIKILINELSNIMSDEGQVSEETGSDPAFFDDDDWEEDEDELDILDSVSRFSLENHLVQHSDLLELKKTDIKSGIVSETDLKTYLIQFFKSCVQDSKFQNKIRYQLNKDEVVTLDLTL